MARIVGSIGLVYIGVNGAITAAAEANAPQGPTGNAIVIASPPPLASWSREIITGGDGLYAVDGEALPGVPLERCDLAGAKAASRQVAAFLFWSRTPFVVPGEDGGHTLYDARFYDPRARDRFAVSLPEGVCAEPPAS